MFQNKMLKRLQQFFIALRLLQSQITQVISTFHFETQHFVFNVKD